MILAGLLAACMQYRTYPMMTLELPAARLPLEPTGIAVLEDGRMVVVAEGDANALLVPDPDRPLRSGDVLGVFPLRAAAAGEYRATIRLRPEPITWLTRDHELTAPYNIEDLAPFGADRVIGVTEYTTVGRRTGYRRDYIARSRRQTERLFVLERRLGADGAPRWEEIAVPEVDRLRELLSDWGRANCGDDMLVEGLAWDPAEERVFVGLRRCGGPVQRVLRYRLGSARRGLAASLEVEADGIDGSAGPEEGVSGLTWGDGRLWASTAWDSHGYAREPAFSGRLHEVRGGRLAPADLAGPFVDRPAGLAILGAPTADGLDTIVLFDNDASAGSPMRPNVTVLQARTPRPSAERFAQAIALRARPNAPSMGLNGFDFRWWVRDHRLSQLAAGLERRGVDPPAAWTRAIGGLWQMQVGGAFGMLSRALPGLQKRMGHNKQAVAYTDYTHVPGIRFTGYEVALSVVPRDRERQNPSVARLLESAEAAYRVTVPLPRSVEAGAGLVLQGFSIDTSSRADRGICVAALDLGVDWHDASLTSVDVQTTIIGGLCNDFDVRGPDLHHGRTTAINGGVRVLLQFAVVEGVPSVPWSARVHDRDVPGPRAADAGYAEAPIRAIDDARARAHLHCVSLAADGGLRVLPRADDAPPESWLKLGAAVVGTPTRTASLRRFQLALDPVGFDATLAPRPLTEEEALNRNNYVYRYLLRVFPNGAETMLEGGLSHGIHARGPMRDNARPSALSLRADMTGFPTADERAVRGDIVWPRRLDDPNLQPEDGFIRASATRPLLGPPACSTAW